MEYLTTDEVCDKLKIHYNTLHKLCKKGLPFFKIGRSKRFELNKVTDWLKARTETKINKPEN